MTEPRPSPRAAAIRPENVRRIGARASAFADLYHYLLTTSWPKFLSLVSGAYLCANVVFAALYSADPRALEGGTGRTFIDAFFFSVQTMATIGYGKLTPRTHFANSLVTVEALVGMLAMAMATGLMFAKFSRPTARVRFSSKCLVQRRDGVPTLVFRMVNERLNQIVEAQVHVVLLTDERTLEGERIRRLRDLTLVRDTTPAFALSWMVFHPITEQSPLYEMTREALIAKNAAVLVSFVGLDDTLNATVHVRQFYSFEDIAFGMRFLDMLKPDADQRVLDLSRIDLIEPEPAAAAPSP
jgi:inward rectifier potassium channel